MHTLTGFRPGIGLSTVRACVGRDGVASRGKRLYCALRCPVPSFETYVPGAGQPHPVTGQFGGGSRGRKKRAKTTRGHHTPYRNWR